MRKWVVISLAVWLALGLATAFADVTITATITKDKDKTVTETLTKTKTVDLDVLVVATPDKFSESEAIVNQSNFENEVCENCAEKRDQIINSGNSNSGVVTVNQAAGNMNNQGSAISIAVDVPTPPSETPGTETGFAEAQASVEQENTVNLVESINILFREATIDTSYNDNTGVVHVNQSAGNMNNQANALSIAVSFDAGVALAESDLGQFNTGNTVLETNVGTLEGGEPKLATITGSVNGNSGVIGVNQSAGNMANQANVVSFAVTRVATP
jgi:hypothetical protein